MQIFYMLYMIFREQPSTREIAQTTCASQAQTYEFHSQHPRKQLERLLFVTEDLRIENRWVLNLTSWSA